ALNEAAECARNFALAVVAAPGAQRSVLFWSRPPGPPLIASTNVDSGTSGIPSKMFESCAPAKLTVPTSVTGTEPLSSITRLARAVLEISRMTGPLSGAGRSGLTAVAVPTTVEAGQVLFATLLGGHAGCPTVATAAAGRTT